MILMISCTDVLQEYFLPQDDGVDYQITLDRRKYHLSKSINIDLEKIGGQWLIKNNSEYIIEGFAEEIQNYTLRNGDLFKIVTSNNSKLSCVVIDDEIRFLVYDKYDIQNLREISIGCNDTCDVSYTFMNFVSREHALITRYGSRWFIEDNSSNGTFLNGQRVNKRQSISFGDEINIFGLRIVFLEQIIAVGTHYGKVNVHNINKWKHVRSENYIVSKNTERDYFHRSPRNVPTIFSGKMKIQPPPEFSPSKKRPLLLQIGPSLTMAIPMILGCSLAIYSSRSNGMHSGAFMYVGIITAVGSALLGAFWALMNIRSTKKEEAAQETLRFDRYGDYLISIANDLKEKYSNNYTSLLKMYPSAQELCQYTQRNTELWSRNLSHKDFMFYRLGLGSMPFQVSLDIPEDKFTLNRDFLREKIKILYNNYQKLENVPIGINVYEKRLVGIVGGKNKQGAVDIMYNIVAGIAANNCYTEVKMVFIYDKTKDNIKQWELMKWFPHVWSENRKTRFMASDINEASDVFYELVNVIRQREEMAAVSSNSKRICKPQYIIFISDASVLENQLLAKYIYHPSEQYGICTFFLADRHEKLPNECEFIIENTNHFKGIYDTINTNAGRININFDNVTLDELYSLARNITENQVQEFESDTELPTSLDFFEMYGVKTLDEFNVLEQWYKNRTYNSMRALIGKKAGGVNCYLDLHEKYHGPHGLVAGTTGSGKSETLQTFILSLALNFSPEDVAFLIIDFKGGGMANLFSDLPHMAGQITNLSGNQIRRAMISIKSENERRQRIFNEYGVNNINLYTRLYKSREAKIPIPHLIIVIDEFAELKREEPDFMRELISVAQVGRSLGVHLILATQKPNGTVDDNIRSNSKFHLCLRVQDRQDSIDMLHKPDAAYITQAGRCYLQVGNDEIYELFQSGWSGAIYDEYASENGENIATMLKLTGKPAIYGSRTKIKRKEQEKIRWYKNIIGIIEQVKKDIYVNKPLKSLSNSECEDLSLSVAKIMTDRYDYGTSASDVSAVNNFVQLYINDGINEPEALLSLAGDSDHGIKLPKVKEKTQLEVIVRYLKNTAEENGFNYDFTLWLPLLPKMLIYNELIKENELRYDGRQWKKLQNDNYAVTATVGLYDDPENQIQLPVKIDFSSSGSLAVCGSVVTGKSTFMQTMVYSLANNYTPQEINMYFIDFSGKKLACFETLPHVGGVMSENDYDKIAKFFMMIDRIMTNRRNILEGGNYNDYIRVHGRIMPAILVVIDNISAFREKTNSIYDNILIKMTREGVSYGIYLAVTSGGFGVNEIPNRLAENIKNVICLELGDRYKYMEILRLSHISIMPETDIKGRGLVKIDDRILEFQTAVSIKADDDYMRTEKLVRFSSDMAENWKGVRAFPIPCIPENPTLTDLSKTSGFEQAINSYNLIPLGYKQEDASLDCINLSNVFCYTISGRQRTGKTTAMKIIMNNAAQKKAKIFVIEKGKNELKAISDRINAEYISDDAGVYKFLEAIKDPFIERNQYKHRLIDMGMDDRTVFEEMQKFPPYFIFISSLEEFMDIVYHPVDGIGQMKGFVNNIIDKGALHNIYFFACMNPENHKMLIGMDAYKRFISYRRGLHLGGCLNNQKLFIASNISFNEQSKSMPKGMAYVPYEEDDTQVYKIIVPQCGGEKH